MMLLKVSLKEYAMAMYLAEIEDAEKINQKNIIEQKKQMRLLI